MSGYEVTWNGVSSTTIPELVCGKVTRKLVGAHRGSFVDMPGRAGSYYFPEERGRRSISIECFVLDTSAVFPTGRRDAVTAVADWVDVNRECRLIMGDQPDVFYNAVLAEAPDVDEWRETGIFELLFEAEPYSYDLAVTTYLNSMVSGVEESYDFGLTTATFPVIEVTPTNGTSAFGFSLAVGDTTLYYASTIATGDTVNINGLGMAVLAGTSNDVNVTGAYDPVDMLMSGVTGEFPVLLPDVNNFTITALGGTATAFDVNFIYRKRYRK